MSFLDDTPWLDGAQEAPPESSFSRGLQSGVTTLRGQANALAGGVGEAVGANDFARERYARSKELQAQAAEEAPPVRSYHDVHDLKSGYDYVTGLLGQTAPLAAGAVGTALLTRGRPLLGSTAALAVPETGDIIERQQEDPVSLRENPRKRLAAAVGGGTASAAVQSLAPAAVASQVLGKTAKTAAALSAKEIAARGAAVAATEGAGGAGGEALKQAGLHQTNQDLAYDPEAIKEAGLANLVAGGAMAVPGAVAEGVHGRASRAGTSVGELTDRGVAKITDALSDASYKAREGYSGLFNQANTKDDAIARAVAQDKPVEPLPPGADPAAHVAQSDAKATEWATAKLKGWLADSTLDAETKAKATDLIDKMGDPTARAEVATMDLARKATASASEFYDHMVGTEGKTMRDKVGSAMESVKDHLIAFAEKPISERVRETQEAISALIKDHDLTDEVRARLEDAANNLGDHAKQAWVATVKKASEFKDALQKGIDIGIPGAEEIFKRTKQSEDYSGVRAVISREIIPAIQKNKPEILANDRSIKLVADGIRAFIQKIEAGKNPQNNEVTMAFLRSFLGADAVPVMERVANAISADPKASERVYAALLDMHEHATNEDALHDIVSSNLVDKKSVSPAQVKEAVKLLKGYARGEFNTKGSESQRAFIERQFRDEMEKVFGKNVGKVLDAFQKAHEDKQARTDLGQRKDGDREGSANDGAGDGADHSLSETDLEYEAPRIYGSKDKGLVLSHEAHAREYGNQESQASKLIARAKKENPDRNVSFVKARDFARERGISDEQLHELTGGKPDDFGIVAAEGQKQEGRITQEQARAMQLDSKAHADSKSRIDTEKTGVTLDAYKITQQTLKGMPYIEGESSPRRTARAFFEGLGSALIHFDTKVRGDLPDNLVVAVRNGVKITYGDIKSYKGPGEFSVSAKLDLESEAKDLQRLIAKTKDEDKRAALLTDLEDVQRKLYGRDKNEGRDSESPAERLKREMGVYEFDPNAEIHLAALEHEKAGTLKRTPEEVAPKMAKEPTPEAPIAAKEPTEHVAARKQDATDDAKDIVSGGSAAEAAVAAATKSNSPIVMRALVKAINDTRIKSDRERLNANDAIDKLNKALGDTLKKSPDAAYEPPTEARRRPTPRAKPVRPSS
jgi:hypothetical protein